MPHFSDTAFVNLDENYNITCIIKLCHDFSIAPRHVFFKFNPIFFYNWSYMRTPNRLWDASHIHILTKQNFLSGCPALNASRLKSSEYKQLKRKIIVSCTQSYIERKIKWKRVHLLSFFFYDERIPHTMTNSTFFLPQMLSFSPIRKISQRILALKVKNEWQTKNEAI